MNPLYYHPSGRFTPGGVLALLLVGLLAAVPLALLYAYAIWYIPFVYINFGLTLGFGFGLGWLLQHQVRTRKLRNPRVVGWLAVAIGLWAWYVQWCAYLALWAGAGETESLGSRASFTHTTFQENVFLNLLLSPGTLLELLRDIGSDGLWSVFGVTVSGVFLYLIWALELLLIVAVVWSMPLMQADQPFSELANQWAEKTTLPGHAVHFPDAQAAKLALEADDWEYLQPRAPEDVLNTSPFSRLHIFQAPADPECCYLTLESVTVGVDKKGQTSENATEVVVHLRVPPQVCAELRTRFGTETVVMDAASYTGTYQ